ncbi:glycosyltransferase [Desulfosporosinus hippei]|uniref:Glycosyltransferase involved in cell wall bisynthesis n=1 Tax=Desulfosporosinus hippei DSM 8344 TaxID=1121419 RepID=A0A1G8EVK1_9FIRM|nr:glycosyltransferase [Desulfosporosinus hippei]SDH73739.1 Glycosyltransferase involved in cell wall bisynthesis [Desulfosporosinus hippei DSM 8344]
MKKIVFISNRLGGGGAERVLTMIANRLAQTQEYTVSVFAMNKCEKNYYVHEAIHVTELDGTASKLQTIKLIRKHILIEKPDVIVAFEYHINMKVLIATLGMKLHIIISERNDPARKGGKPGLKQLRNLLYRKADCLVCQTPDAKAYFPQFIQNRTVVIPNPIKEDLPVRWQGKRNYEIVSFCRLEKQKNLPLLIDAFALVHKDYPEYKLSLYGDGSEKNRIETYILKKSLQDCISLHGSIIDIHEKIVDCAMFVSSSDYEGLSNSMIEAMALGLPCIVTDCPCGGARMMIDSYVNGILVPVGDAQALYEAIKYVIQNPEKAEFMSKNGTNMRRNLAVGKIVSEWETII